MKKHKKFNFSGPMFGCLFSILIVVILASLIIPVLWQGKGRPANIVKSLRNLREIGLALKLYASDNNDQYPPGYSPEVVYRQLIPTYIPNNQSFILPDPKTSKNAVITNTILQGQCGYTYISGSSEDSDEKNPLATERVHNPFTLSNTNQTLKEVWHGGGVNVLYVDGSVSFLRSRSGVLSNLFTDAQIREGKLRPRNPVSPVK